MGYQSSYHLTIERPTIKEDQEIIEEFRKQYCDAAYALDEEGQSGQSSKWYEAENDIRDFSIKYPHFIFILDRIGEDGELSRIVAQNGESQVQAPTIQYSPSKFHK